MQKKVLDALNKVAKSSAVPSPGSYADLELRSRSLEMKYFPITWVEPFDAQNIIKKVNNLMLKFGRLEKGERGGTVEGRDRRQAGAFHRLHRHPKSSENPELH